MINEKDFKNIILDLIGLVFISNKPIPIYHKKINEEIGANNNIK